MNHTTLAFSGLLSAGYSLENHILEILFADGTVQRYANVPSTIYFSLIHAYSHDNYFEQCIQSIFRIIK